MEKERISYTKKELENLGYETYGCVMVNGHKAFMKVGSRYYSMEIKKEDEGCRNPVSNKSLECNLQV